MANKQDLIDFVSRDLDVSENKAGNIIDSVVSGIKKLAIEDDKMTLVNFGTFEIRKRAPRTARNLMTQEPLLVPATYVPVFRPAVYFKSSVESAHNK